MNTEKNKQTDENDLNVREMWLLALGSLHFLKESTSENICLLETAPPITEPACKRVQEMVNFTTFTRCLDFFQESHRAVEYNVEE